MGTTTSWTNQWIFGILFLSIIACSPNREDQNQENAFNASDAIDSSSYDNTSEESSTSFDKEKFLGAELTYSGTTQIGDALEEYTFEFFHLDGSRPTVKINSKFEAELTKDANGDYYLTSSELAGGKFLNVGGARMTYITNANQVFGTFYKE
jgi:hypothetical protein